MKEFLDVLIMAGIEPQRYQRKPKVKHGRSQAPKGGYFEQLPGGIMLPYTGGQVLPREAVPELPQGPVKMAEGEEWEEGGEASIPAEVAKPEHAPTEYRVYHGHLTPDIDGTGSYHDKSFSSPEDAFAHFNRLLDHSDRTYRTGESPFVISHYADGGRSFISHGGKSNSALPLRLSVRHNNSESGKSSIAAYSIWRNLDDIAKRMAKYGGEEGEWAAKNMKDKFFGYFHSAIKEGTILPLLGALDEMQDSGLHGLAGEAGELLKGMHPAAEGAATLKGSSNEYRPS